MCYCVEAFGNRGPYYYGGNDLIRRDLYGGKERGIALAN